MQGYRVINHRIAAQHIREYPRALADEQEDVLHLAVKQYIPEDNPHAQPGDVTIIAAHANGFPKELYEPVWEDLLNHTRKNKWRIRSIWIADVAHQGESSAINEDLLGDDPSWFDHSRDLLHLINMKREEMPRPLIGIGHSMGGGQLVNLSYIHPRLLTSLVLIDPVIQNRTAEISTPESPSPAYLSTFRRDIWPSREEAAKLFLKSPYYQKWNPRVFKRWLEHGLRDTPTLLHPNAPANSVTLATPVTHEVHQFVRPNYDGWGSNGKPINRVTHADVNPASAKVTPFYRPEPPAIFARLPEVRPSVLYIFGADSTVSTPEVDKIKVTTTGTGVGGSGGVKEGRVKGITFASVGHLVAMEAVERTAEEIGKWIGSEMEIWQDQQRWWLDEWKPKPLTDKQALDDQWRNAFGGPLIRKKSKL